MEPKRAREAPLRCVLASALGATAIDAAALLPAGWAVQSIDLLQGQGIITTVEEFRGAWHEAKNTTAVYYSISVEEASSLVVEEEQVED